MVCVMVLMYGIALAGPSDRRTLLLQPHWLTAISLATGQGAGPPGCTCKLSPRAGAQSSTGQGRCQQTEHTVVSLAQ